MMGCGNLSTAREHESKHSLNAFNDGERLETLISNNKQISIKENRLAN